MFLKFKKQYYPLIIALNLLFLMPLWAQNQPEVPAQNAAEAQKVSDTEASPAIEGDEGEIKAAATGPKEVVVVHLSDEPIVSATERYMMSRLDLAEEKNIPYLLVLDTPGGAVDTTRAIVRRMLSAKVPVLVMVGPPGARAGSAGVFITMASHIAAMNPGTNIGAAHPIGAGVGAPPREGEADEGQAREGRTEDEVLAEKIENDLVAFAEAIAKVRNRNVEWAIKAVRDSDSVAADTALELGVVDLIVDDIPDFLSQIDGREVKTERGMVILNTDGAQIIERPMTLREELQTQLGDPNIAYLLGSLGVMGIVLELYNPGMMIGAIVGGICLVLSAASGLPFSTGGILLLAAAGVLFVLEVYVTSFGLLSMAGAGCLVLGGIFLFEDVPTLPGGGSGAEFEVGLQYLGGVGGMAALFAILIAVSIGKAHGKKPVGGRQGLLGQRAKVVGDFGGPEGKVFVNGEFWRAEGPADLKDGDWVVVEAVEGLLLTVRVDDK